MTASVSPDEKRQKPQGTDTPCRGVSEGRNGTATWKGRVNIFKAHRAAALAWVAEGSLEPRNLVHIYGPLVSYVQPIVCALISS
jgi:hypothetical protein